MVASVQHALAIDPPSERPFRVFPPDQKESERLWLCIRLPDLPADAARISCTEPLVVVNEQKGRATVFAANARARQYGIRNGMPLAAALPLCAKLDVRVRDKTAEGMLLGRVMALAYSYSGQVAIYETASLVLEIRNSRNLYGGISSLLGRITIDLDALHIHYCYAIAPFARAAYWLAYDHHGSIVENVRTLMPLLRSLPVKRLCDSDRTRLRLLRSGIRTLADVMRLPRQDAGRRYGVNFFRQLDEALGYRPEAFEYYRPPERFSAEHDFYQPTDRQDWIQAALDGLLQKLELFLLHRQRAVQRFECRLYHEKNPATRLFIGTSQATTHAAHWLQLLRERLQNIVLPAEVTALEIIAGEFLRPVETGCDLFQCRNSNRQSWSELLDCLHARLGRYAVQAFTLNADHRPEYAHCRQVAAGASMLQKKRPLGLLSEPELLDCRAGRPFWQGKPLRLPAGCERIEQGWWAQHDIRRDYYETITNDHRRLWVFRDLRSGKWFLHGFFS